LFKSLKRFKFCDKKRSTVCVKLDFIKTSEL